MNLLVRVQVLVNLDHLVGLDLMRRDNLADQARVIQVALHIGKPEVIQRSEAEFPATKYPLSMLLAHFSSCSNLKKYYFVFYPYTENKSIQLALISSYTFNIINNSLCDGSIIYY